MLKIGRPQLQQMESAWLGVLKLRVAQAVATRCPGLPAPEAFAREAVESARTLRIDQPAQIERYALALADLRERDDGVPLKQFVRVMLSEESAEARLRFVERHLLPAR